MKPKTIFFDIDGTLLGTRGGRPFQIPESTLRALEMAKRNGHRIAVCTGRPEVFVRRFFPGFFENFIAMNGTHIVFEGETVYDGVFPPERVRSLLDHFDSFGCSYLFVGKKNAWARNIPPKLLQKLTALYGLPEYVRLRWEPEEVCANVMDFVIPGEEEFQKQSPAFTGGMILNRHPGGLTGDLSLPGCDKAAGIARFLEYSGIAKEDTVAFGDGYNDIPLMSAVGCGVAMGNAVDEVKKAAGYVTADLFDGGICKGLKHLGLI